jgi:hypothetical protein
MPLTIQLHPSERQTAFNLERWRELLADRDLARLNPPAVTDKNGELWAIKREERKPGFRHRFVSFSRDGALIVALADAKEGALFTDVAVVYDAHKSGIVAGPLRLQGQKGAFDLAEFSDDKKFVAVVSGEVVYLWNITKAGAAQFFREFRNSHHILEVCFSRDSRELLVRTESDEMALWDIETGRRLTDFQRVLGTPNAQPSDGYSKTWDAIGRLGPAPAWIRDLAGAVSGFDRIRPLANRVASLQKISKDLQGDIFPFACAHARVRPLSCARI